jgi:hypothetical protein
LILLGRRLLCARQPVVADRVPKLQLNGSSCGVGQDGPVVGVVVALGTVIGFGGGTAPAHAAGTSHNPRTAANVARRVLILVFPFRLPRPARSGERHGRTRPCGPTTSPPRPAWDEYQRVAFAGGAPSKPVLIISAVFTGL